ncbi:MAG: thiamine phosphate synthase [Candidatus Adiutrix sp.]|jgi:thiamine-phosphate pyrophosphorylase|nr:thiamine phosphate synthase [Candidatus Adiutrix sp.]
MRPDLAERLRLTLVVSRDEAAPRAVTELAEAAFAGGVTALQLREKGALSDREFYEEALELREFCRARNRLFLLDDRLDLALAADADGVHLGQKDLPAAVAARLLPPGRILGVSVRTVAEARAALADGAAYLGVGAVFPTGSKDDAVLVKPETVREISALGAPTVAIGGLTLANVKAAWALGVTGLAVISALTRAADPRAAAAGLLEGAGI